MRNCGNCCYKDLKITEEPCMRCRFNEYWEADDEEKQEDD